MSQQQVEQLAQRLGRPAQSLAALSAQPDDVLDTLLEGIGRSEHKERERLEAAYHQALPAWLSRLIIPWLRR